MNEWSKGTPKDFCWWAKGILESWMSTEKGSLTVSRTEVGDLLERLDAVLVNSGGPTKEESIHLGGPIEADINGALAEIGLSNCMAVASRVPFSSAAGRTYAGTTYQIQTKRDRQEIPEASFYLDTPIGLDAGSWLFPQTSVILRHGAGTYDSSWFDAARMIAAITAGAIASEKADGPSNFDFSSSIEQCIQSSIEKAAYQTFNLQSFKVKAEKRRFHAPSPYISLYQVGCTYSDDNKFLPEIGLKLHTCFTKLEPYTLVQVNDGEIIRWDKACEEIAQKFMDYAP